MLATVGCVGRLQPLVGVTSSAPLPRIEVQPGYHKVTFDWELVRIRIWASTRGDGAAQIASPDSVRLDFFLAGGFGSGAAILIGDSLQVPATSVVSGIMRRLIPPPPMLWAALGREALPVTPDTVVHVDGAAIWADLGKPGGVARDLSRRHDRPSRAGGGGGDGRVIRTSARRRGTIP